MVKKQTLKGLVNAAIVCFSSNIPTFFQRNHGRP
jgi:hypothetical protein